MPNKWMRLKADVPGEKDLRETWAQAIKDIRPQGIIFMIDGRRNGAKLKADLSELENDVLSHYRDSLGELQAVHVFVNYVDQWAGVAVEVFHLDKCRGCGNILLAGGRATAIAQPAGTGRLAMCPPLRNASNV